jgi:hypothetical protein
MKSLILVSETENETLVTCSFCWLNFVLDFQPIKRFTKSQVLFSVNCPHCKKESFAFVWDENW